MISLPGLTLTTGRLDEARGILSAYARLIDGGMIPNRFPDAGGSPDYNTVDATLWYFQAIRQYLRATEDRGLLTELYPRLQQIIDCHLNGARHGIRVDPRDGLLCAGEGLSQLTWMDARVGDWVVTPRHGKPVEIQALWYNALRCMAEWAILCGDDGWRYGEIAGRTASSFLKRFPVPESGYLYDVVDTGHGDDASFRPNQLFAAGLPYPLLPVDAARSVVNECEKRLLTPAGLRTLDPADPGYTGIYEGDQWRRDGAYHQGTVWAWLIGPYVDAVLYAFDDRERARRALDPLLSQVAMAGVGTISEIFDGDAPHLPRGCISQAWSVAEVLRALARIKE
jgi:predicted glycogen debranching enzyme